MKKPSFHLGTGLLIGVTSLLIFISTQMSPAMRLALAATPTPTPPCTACKHADFPEPECRDYASAVAQETEVLSLLDATIAAAEANVAVDDKALEVLQQSITAVDTWLESNTKADKDVKEGGCWFPKIFDGIYYTYIPGGTDGDPLWGDWYTYQLPGDKVYPVRGKRKRKPTPQPHSDHNACPIFIEASAPGVLYHEYSDAPKLKYGSNRFKVDEALLTLEYLGSNFDGACNITNYKIGLKLSSAISRLSQIKQALETSFEEWQDKRAAHATTLVRSVTAAGFHQAQLDTAEKNLKICETAAFPNPVPKVCGCH